MRTSGSTLLRCALLAAASVPTLAIAQTPESTNASRRSEASAVEEIVIVGSRVQGIPKGALPVGVVQQEELEVYGGRSTGELVTNIPQVGGVQFSDNNTGTNGARGDVTGVNLRGLGSGNTLSLIDGRRMAVHPTSEAVDNAPVTFYNVNTIPSTLIGRVEVLRDGASALYGADATAGVVNFSTVGRYEGLTLTGRYDFSDKTSLESMQFTLLAGRSFNDDRTQVTVAATYFDRSKVFLSEFPDEYAKLDKRPFLPADWAGDTQFDNRSAIGPYGAFTSGRLGANGVFTPVRVRQGTTNLTTAAGVLHMEPATGGGTRVVSGAIPRDMRYDFNVEEAITPAVERWNAAVKLTHDFDSGLNAFGDVSYYSSTSKTQRAAGPFDASLAYIVVPASNYYNPFGPVGSPNRLPGIDAPAAGLDLVIDGYRPLEHGPRIIHVEQESYRVLGGFRGEVYGWDWESAGLYTRATARDEEFNRMSKNLLQRQMALSTPQAFNPFGGPNANSQAVLDAVRISGVRYGVSSLTSWDLRLNKDSLFKLPGGDVGAAFGLEWRREYLRDDSDPRLDGTITFKEGLVPDESDMVGVSATADFSGSRHVFSTYGELVLPLVGEGNRMPLVHRLDVQLAARYENGSDFGGAFTPKVGLFWSPVAPLSVRASYGEGFRAPNLAQINQGTITRRVQGDVDYWRSSVTATLADIGDTYRPSLRLGNPDLKPEKSKTYSAGVVFEPTDGFLRGFSASIDWWRFEQTGLIGTFGVQSQLALDYLMRKSGGSNPLVVRAAPTALDIQAFNAWNATHPNDQRAVAGEVLYVVDSYINLDPREVEGIDYEVVYRSPETDFGVFGLRVNASQTLSRRQERPSLRPLLEDPFLKTQFAAVNENLVELNGNPKWRWTTSGTWDYGPWSAGFNVRYVGPVFDTSARNDTTAAFWRVGSWTTVSARAAYTFEQDGMMGETTIAIGATNLFNKLPPLADESPGYFGSLHSLEGRVIYVELKKSL